MPSSNKTPHLQLNKWLGSDKPRKDDFNADNLTVDTAMSRLAERVGALEEGGGSGAGAEELIEALAAHTANAAVHTTAAQKQALESHAANAAVHVTAAEKAAWNSAGGDNMVIGTFTGTGSAQRTVDMGFKPKAGFFFGVGQGPFEMNFAMEEMQCHAGFFSKSGCSTFVALTASGISLTHNATVPMGGCAYRYNASGITYVYIAWPE